jgi:hypothetical protein
MKISERIRKRECDKLGDKMRARLKEIKNSFTNLHEF